jgi:RNA polymerase sigma-70 factor (ECF subfamily)
LSARSSRVEHWLERADRGDPSAVGRLLDHYRGRLRSSVARRFDRRLASRLDPSDVVQETLIDARRRLPEYCRDRPVSFFAWLRGLADQRLIGLRRFHLGSSKRSLGRERADDRAPGGRAVVEIPCDDTSPSGHAAREEEHERVYRAMGSLGEPDREILDLRYRHDLAFAEIAERLGIGVGAAKMRHLRAVERLRSRLDGGHDAAGPR